MSLKEEHRQAFYATFKAMKNLKFLMKWESDRPRDLPASVKISSWFPQQDILGNLSKFYAY